MPIIEKLEKEKGVKVEKYEIWHNDENEKKFDEVNKNFCPGVPFFFNTDNSKTICGAVPEDEFITFATQN